MTVMDLAQQSDAVHPRHAHVGEDDVELAALGRAQCFAGIACVSASCPGFDEGGEVFRMSSSSTMRILAM